LQSLLTTSSPFRTWKLQFSIDIETHHCLGLPTCVLDLGVVEGNQIFWGEKLQLLSTSTTCTYQITGSQRAKAGSRVNWNEYSIQCSASYEQNATVPIFGTSNYCLCRKTSPVTSPTHQRPSVSSLTTGSPFRTQKLQSSVGIESPPLLVELPTGVFYRPAP
jgi:hypothetical protein